MFQGDRTMSIEVTLVPHVGSYRDPEGREVKVEHDQFIVQVSGDTVEKIRGKPFEQIGYVSKKPGKPIVYLKVAAVFGEFKAVIDQAVRAALIEHAKARVEAARAATAEAEKVKAEVDEFLGGIAEEARQEKDARAAKLHAEAGVAAAEKALRDAMEKAGAEGSGGFREGKHPDPKVLEELNQDGGNVVEDSTEDDLADSQNL